MHPGTGFPFNRIPTTRASWSFPLTWMVSRWQCSSPACSGALSEKRSEILHQAFGRVELHRLLVFCAREEFFAVVARGACMPRRTPQLKCPGSSSEPDRSGVWAQSEAEHSMAYLEISSKKGNGIDFTKCAITRESRRVDKPRDRGEGGSAEGRVLFSGFGGGTLHVLSESSFCCF